VIIGLVGFKWSGKDTTADILVNDYGFHRIAFADSIKDCLASIFCWDREMMEGRTTESRKWREEIDVWWANKLGIELFSPRWAMTHFGTELMRNKFDQDIWIYNVQRRLEQQSSKNLVISDCRFPNEISVIRGQNGKIWRVDRGYDPLWIGAAKIAARSFRHNDSHWNIPIANARAILKESNVHESEWSWLDEEIDISLLNAGSMLDLGHNIKNAMKSVYA
jgi:hypothetical protein